MACSVTSLTGSFGSCSTDILASNFNKDSVFWYIENEDSVYNFKLTLSPFLSSTPIKILYPEVEIINVKTLSKTISFPPFNASNPDTFASLLDFSFCNQDRSTFKGFFFNKEKRN